MKIVASLFALTFSSFAIADSAKEPLHGAEDVLEAVYKAASATAESVDVVVFKYDYLSGQWHVELSPAKEECLDCFPAFFIKNTPVINVSKRIHG